MKVTLRLLEQWGACARYRKIFAEQYPDGVDGSAAEIAAIPKAEYDQWWILVEMACRLSDRDGAEALRLATERVDPSRLAALAVRVKDKDTTAAVDKLLASDGLLSIKRVADKGTGDAKARAASALTAKGVV